MAAELRTVREVYAGGALLADLESFGWARLRSAGASPLGEHRHPGHEVCLVLRGTMDWWAGDQAYTVPAGHVYVTRPDEPHGAETAQLQPCDLYWLILSPSASGNSRFGGLPLREHRAAPASDAIRIAFEALHREYRAPSEDSSEVAQGWLRVLLAEVRRAILRRAVTSPSSIIARAMEAASAGIEAGCDVDRMAGVAGLSRSRFDARFRAEVGEPPATWLRRQRLERSKALLGGDDRVSEIAHRLGFASSQHFATAFRGHFGLTPTAYRAQMVRLG